MSRITRESNVVLIDLQAVTVREGESCFITRLKAPWNLEIRHEFTPQGMTQVSIALFVTD